MKKIIIIAKFGNSIAVWNALKLHIKYIIAAGYTPIIFVDNLESKEVVFKEFGNYKILVVKNFLLLFVLLIKYRNVSNIWCPDAASVLKVGLSKIIRSSKICFWSQGIIPEESYMRNKSRLRKFILGIIEKSALAITSKYILVSETMKTFYEQKYNIKIKNFIIVPCASEFSYNPMVEKIPNSFVYIGGLSEWQCFDDILCIFKQIISLEPNSIFHIITLEIENANFKLKQIFGDNSDNIFIYPIEDRAKLPDILSKFEYGFLIREANPVNFVSSPIKFAEYLSCGINVVISDSVPHYARLINQDIGLVLKYPYNIKKLSLISNKEKALEIYKENFSEETMICRYVFLLN